MQAKNCRRILIAARAASGWLALLAPGAVARLWRLERPLRGDVSYLIRVFGIRNVILAYLLYQAERVDATDEDLEEMLRVGIAVDLFDTAPHWSLGAQSQQIKALLFQHSLRP